MPRNVEGNDWLFDPLAICFILLRRRFHSFAVGETIIDWMLMTVPIDVAEILGVTTSISMASDPVPNVTRDDTRASTSEMCAD
jgi:hypothetical protein